tara:strand:+ start:491 stop:718 length:228 start_codon:yes stop_codon:yes gene_type:complete
MKYVYKFYEYIIDKISYFIDYLLERIKFMIVLREQDKWMRDRAKVLTKRDWHRMYVEESKKQFPDLWEEEEDINE